MSKNSTKTISAKERLQRLTISAVFIALAVVAKTIQIPVYILGYDGMHISAAGLFSTLPALLFGPLYGGAVSGIVDVIGFFAAGTAGAFNPLYTLTAILNGVLKGLLWNLFLRLKNIKIWDRAQFVLLVLRLLATLGIANLVYTTLNTFIIIWMSSKLSMATFWIFHTPRLIEELIMIVLQSFFIAWILLLVRKIGGTAISKDRL